MLDGKINVRTDFVFFGHEFKKSLGEIVCLWVGIKHPNPAGAFQFDQTPQELLKICTVSAVFSIGGGILSDEDKFLDSPVRKPFCLFQYRPRTSTSIRSSDLRNGAEGAGFRATLCDLKIGGKGRGGEDSGCPFVIEKSGFGDETLSLPSLG
jgi:hypothetical protein